MNWDPVNVWTNTLYTLIHSLNISKKINFGDLNFLHENVLEAGTWVKPNCSYESVLLEHPFGRAQPKFRRDPNEHFGDISNQIIKMLIQDLVVIMDQMMEELLKQHNEKAGGFPQSKIQKLTTHLDSKYKWASHGCLELVAARNVFTHGAGRWNQKTLSIIAPFVFPAPKEGDKLSVGFSMLFRYRKAMRTFLNEVARP